MKPKTMMLLLVAVGCGLGAAILATKFLSKDTVRYRVLVAKKHIPKGTLLKDEKFVRDNFELTTDPKEINEIPEKVRTTGVLMKDGDAGDYITDDLKAKFKDHVFEKKLEPMEPLLKDDLVEKNKAGLATKLREGFTGFAVKVTADSGVAGLIQPDDYVKVVSTKKMPSGDRLSKIVMKNIRVVAIDQMSERETQPGQGPAPKVATTVTLEVTDDEQKVLKGAQDESPLSLSLISTPDVEKMNQAVEKKRDELEKKYKGQDDEASLKKKTDELSLYVREHRVGEETSKPSKPRIEDLLRPGYFAYGINVTAGSSSGGWILPGNRVNVFGVKRIKLRGEDKKKSFLIMKNIRVVAVDDLTTDDKSVTVIVAKVITLEVSDAEAKKLQEAEEEAKINLAVIGKADLAKGDADRTGDDESEPAPEPAKPAEVAQPNAPKLPRAIQIISGESKVLYENNGILGAPAAAPPPTQTFPTPNPNR